MKALSAALSAATLKCAMKGVLLTEKLTMKHKAMLETSKKQIASKYYASG